MFELRLGNETENIIDINDGISYIVLGCSGLNPPSATIFTSKSPNRKGVKYNGSTLNERNIIITVKILGDIEQNRNALYSWIDTESYVKVYYRNATKNVYCEGHITDAEIEYFTENEVVNIAIICENPYWKDLQDISVDISSLLAQFTFPFAIDSAGIPFSTVREDNSTVIMNTGTETGCQITLHFSGICNGITIYNARNVAEQMVISRTFIAGETVVIDTEGSPKRITLIDTDGESENILRNVGNNPTWFVIKSGVNQFGYSAVTGESNMSMTISFTNKYLGV